MAADEKAVELDSRDWDDDDTESGPLRRWVRAFLITLTAPWIVVFAIAIWLDPYQSEDGGARRAGTHMQLGLPDCNFKALAGVPCPSCGMTTSFSLLLHADVWNSLQANFAGTLLAGFGLFFVPWAFSSAFLGRFVLVRSLELAIFRLAVVFLVVLFGRWAIVLVMDLLLK
jgi:hypothetical protein